jgi:hypothetical protein
MTFQARLPYFRVSGPPGVLIGPDGQPVSQSSLQPTGISRRSGLGDPTLSFAYFLIRDARQRLDARVIVKLTAGSSAQRLSSGSNDYSLEARYQLQRGAVTPFAVLGYRIVGGSTGLALQNTPYASVGTSVRLTSRWSTGAALQWRATLVVTRPAATDLAVFARARVNPQWAIDSYLAHGFSASAPDLSAGISLIHRFQ